MAELSVQFITLDGITPAAAVAADAAGDRFDNDGFTFLEVNNGGGAPIDVTIIGQRQLPAGTSATRVVSVTNGTTERIGPFPKTIFNTDLSSEVNVEYSAVTTVTVRVFSVKDENN